MTIPIQSHPDEALRLGAAEWHRLIENPLTTDVHSAHELEAAARARLAGTTCRDGNVNTGLPNQFPGFAGEHGIDAYAVIEACNSQPFSHFHQAGIAVCGPCICPVYPRVSLYGDAQAIVGAAAREANSDLRAYAGARFIEEHGEPGGTGVGVLGAPNRRGRKETTFSDVSPVVAEPPQAEEHVVVHNPMFSHEEIMGNGWHHFHFGTAVIHANHGETRFLSPADLTGVRATLDGRRVLAAGARDPRVIRLGQGCHGATPAISKAEA